MRSVGKESIVLPPGDPSFRYSCRILQIERSLLFCHLVTIACGTPALYSSLERSLLSWRQVTQASGIPADYKVESMVLLPGDQGFRYSGRILQIERSLLFCYQVTKASCTPAEYCSKRGVYCSATRWPRLHVLLQNTAVREESIVLLSGDNSFWNTCIVLQFREESIVLPPGDPGFWS
jgi:hypothetical protein